MRALIRLSAGLVAWAVAFCGIYALHGVGCAYGWQGQTVAGLDLQRAILVAAWAVAVAGASVVAVRLSRAPASTLDRAAAATGWIGFAACVVTFLPILAVPACL